MTRLFGTDGIRGIANVDLQPPLAYDLGRATAAQRLRPGRQLLVGQDTRRSGDMLVAAIVGRRDVDGRRRPSAGRLPHAGPGPSRTGSGRLRRRRSWSRRRTTRPRDNGLKVLDAQRPQARRRGRGRARGADLRADELASPDQRRPGPRDRRPRAARRLRRDRPPSRARQDAPCDARSSSTAPTARRGVARRDPRRAPAPRVDVRFDEPDGININLDCGATAPAARSPRSSPRPAPTSASPSTATPTVAWPSTSAARSSTATS